MSSKVFMFKQRQSARHQDANKEKKEEEEAILRNTRPFTKKEMINRGEIG